MSRHCPLCGVLCSVAVYDGKSGMKEWECNPFRGGGIIKRVTHYSFITQEETLLHRTLVVDPYKIIIKDSQTTIMKHSSAAFPYYKIVCEVDSAMDLTNFDKEKFLKKLKTYTVFA